MTLSRARKQAIFRALFDRYRATCTVAVARKQASFAYYRLTGEAPFRAFLPAALEFESAPAKVLADLFKLSPAEAIEYMQQKGYNITWNWKEQVGAAHRKAFTVAKATKMDMLTDIRAAVQDAIDNGTSLHDFKKNLRPKLEQKGFFGVRTITKEDGTVETATVLPSRLENIMRTNVQSSYNAGRYKAASAVAAERPYLQYLAISDDSTTDVCSKLNGKVFRQDDPFWDKYTPPNHFQCRSTTRTLNDRQLTREGLAVEQGANYENANDLTGSQGFDYNPALIEWMPDFKSYDPDIAAAGAAEIAAVEAAAAPPSTKVTAAEAKKLDKEAMRAYNDLVTNSEYTVDDVSFADVVANAKNRIAGVKVGKLSSDEKAVLAGYTSEYSDDGGGWLYKVNNELRNKDLAKPSAFTEQITKVMQNALRKAPKYVDDRPLIREIRVPPDQYASVIDAAYKPGEEVTWHAFSSTTRKLEGADFGHVRFMIHGHSGKGVDVSKLSAEEQEEEVLLPAGSRFRVRSMTKEPSGRTLIELDML